MVTGGLYWYLYVHVKDETIIHSGVETSGNQLRSTRRHLQTIVENTSQKTTGKNSEISEFTL